MRRPIIDAALAIAEKVAQVKTRLVFHVGFDDGAGVDDAVDLDAAEGAGPSGGRVDQVVLLAATTTDLRRAVTLHELFPPATSMIVAVGGPVDRGLPVILPPTTRGRVRLESFEASRSGDGWVFNMLFSGPAPPGEIVIRIARGLTGTRMDPGFPVHVDTTGPAAAHWRPGDPGISLRAEIEREAGDGHPRCEVDAETPPTWGELGRRDAIRPALAGPEAIPPVDEVTVNPCGFLSFPDGPMARMSTRRDGRWQIPAGDGDPVCFASSGAVTDADVARLRSLRAVRLDWSRPHTGPVAAARVVAGLAAAGVPQVSEELPLWARDLIGRDLADLLASATEDDLTDDLAREEHSVLLRRSAMAQHSTRSRWERLAGRPATPPTVSVLMCTRRPDMVPFGLRHVARQRDVGIELILALHGIPLDDDVQRQIDELPFPVTAFEAPAGLLLGEVLNRAAARASGTFLAKMDDDDWYGPRHLADLFMAHSYTGADMLGCAAEFVYLEPIHTTVRRRIPGEVAVPVSDSRIGGGTLFLPRSVLGAVGGFPALGRSEDTWLITTVAAGGGRVYRIHGLGFILRRRARPLHTWQQSMGYFLREKTVAAQWRGLRATRLMELS